MRTSEAVLVFLIMSVICVINGCEKQPLRPSMIMGDTEDVSLYELGIIWVGYYLTFHQTDVEDDIPVAVVNDFLIEKGYTPKVVQTRYQVNGEVIEVIYIGSDIDPLPLFKEIEALEGVSFATSQVAFTHDGNVYDPAMDAAF